MINEKELEIYYDHYKDTFTHLRNYITSRDKVFYITLGLLILVFFQSDNPEITEKISINIIKKNVGDEIVINTNFINSLLLFALLSLVIKYFQINLLIERQYKYLHKLEEDLTSNLSFEISREGKSYIEAYPFVSKVIHRIYTIVFPIILILVILKKGYTELTFFKCEWENLYLLFDLTILLLIIILTIQYLVWIQFKDFKKKKK